MGQHRVTPPFRFNVAQRLPARNAPRAATAATGTIQRFLLRGGAAG